MSQCARARVFKTSKIVHEEPPTKRQKTGAASLLFTPPVMRKTTEEFQYSLTLEQLPKWHALDEVLDEIASIEGISSVSVVILVKDEYTSIMLQNYLHAGGRRLLKHKFIDYVRLLRNSN